MVLSISFLVLPPISLALKKPKSVPRKYLHFVASKNRRTIPYGRSSIEAILVCWQTPQHEGGHYSKSHSEWKKNSKKFKLDLQAKVTYLAPDVKKHFLFCITHSTRYYLKEMRIFYVIFFCIFSTALCKRRRSLWILPWEHLVPAL